MKRYAGLLLLVILLATGCRNTAPERDYQTWSPSDFSTTVAGNDPIEPFNRAMFCVNEVLMDYVIRPVTWVYGSILPREAVARIYYASENLAFPGRMVSCFCQLKFKNGGIVLCRFLINSTLGIVGLFDPADAWFGMKPRYENMGHAFASWGIPSGCLLFLPGDSATNVRDQFGFACDCLLDIKFILPYAQSASAINRAIYFYESFSTLTHGVSDPYEQMKLALLMQHIAQSGDHMHNPIDFKEDTTKRKTSGKSDSYVKHISPVYESQTPAIDSMKFLMFQMQKSKQSIWLKDSLWNHDFDRQGEERSVRFDKNRPEMPYHFWPGTNGELVFLLPGVGGHHRNPQVTAMSELLNDQGFSVAVLPSVFNPLFANACGTMLPGYSPDDSENVRQAILLILKDLKTKRKPFIPEKISIGGYSLGGVHALHIARLEQTDPKINLRRIVALNPPVDLSSSIDAFERFGECSKRYTQKEIMRLAGDAAGKFIDFMDPANSYSTSEQKVMTRFPFSNAQASIMTAVSFRLTLREVLENAKRRDPACVKQIRTPWSWWHRTELYRELDQVSGQKYIRDFVLPYQLKKHPGSTSQSLNDQAGLRSLAPMLYKDSRIRVLHNADDPLLSDDDKNFLTRSLGDRILWFDCGGHLGNLYLPEHQKELLKAFAKESVKTK